MTSLPHHRRLFDSATASGLVSSTRHTTVRGPATPIVSAAWVMVYNLTNIGFGAPRDVGESFKPLIKQALLDQSIGVNGTSPDISYDIPLNYQIGAGDTYFSGKMIARLARLAVVANVTGESSAAAVLLARLRERVQVNRA
jgi:endoglucanase Acf2